MICEVSKSKIFCIGFDIIELTNEKMRFFKRWTKHQSLKIQNISNVLQKLLLDMQF